MSHGGGLDPEFHNPLYKEKLAGIDLDTIRGWVTQLCAEEKITKLDGTGSPQLDGKWFSPFMAEIHGTLGCLAVNGGKDVTDLRELHTRGIDVHHCNATKFDGRTPTLNGTKGNLWATPTKH